jgi:hypothetical protein
MEWKEGGELVCVRVGDHTHYFMAYWYDSSSVISERSKRDDPRERKKMIVYFVGLDLMRGIDRLKWILGAGREGGGEREAGERKRPSTSTYTKCTWKKTDE